MRARCTIPALAIGVLLSATPAVSRACRYCEAPTDPESYRFMSERRVGSAFPIDPGDGSFDAAVNAPPLPTAPPATTLVTKVDALQKPTPHQSAAPLPVASPSALPTPRRVPPPASAEKSKAPSISGSTTTAAVRGVESVSSVRLADLGLVGVVATMGWFLWRTRRRQQPRPAALA